MDMAEWIVIVDDNIADLKKAGHILSECGMRITALNSRQALLNYLNDGNCPDLVILDVAMQGIDGFETMKRLRYEAGGNGGIPVIFLSETDEEEEKGLSLGALDFIKKPFVPNVLSMRVGRAVESVALRNKN